MKGVGPQHAEPNYPEYGTIKFKAARTVPAFVDQRYIDQLTEIIGRRGHDWCTAVLGYPFPGLRHTPGSEAHMLVVADEENLRPPLPDRIVAERAARAERDKQETAARKAIAARDARTWRDALAVCKVPHLLTVRPNATGRRLVRGHSTGPNRHVVPAQTLHSGPQRNRPRIHTAGRALCETPKRTPMRLAEPVDAPATCVNCLQYVRLVRLPEQPAA